MQDVRHGHRRSVAIDESNGDCDDLDNHSHDTGEEEDDDDEEQEENENNDDVKNKFEHAAPALTFHPAYCYKDSPTWFRWVKLTAHDVHHRLRPQTGYHVSSESFQGATSMATTISVGDTNRQYDTDTRVLFYLNHPIQFVQLVGMVVAIEDHFEKFWLLTLDDGSGSTIEINCRKPLPSEQQQQQQQQQQLISTGPWTVESKSKNSVSVSVSTRNHKIQPINSKTTDSKNEKIKSQQETDQDLTTTMAKLAPGTIIQIKGTIKTFRSTRQIRLERIKIAQDTTREMHLILSRLNFYKTTLSRPWIVDERRKPILLKEARDEMELSRTYVSRVKTRQLQKSEREERHAKRILKRYEDEEVKRAAAAEEARSAGLLLKREK